MGYGLGPNDITLSDAEINADSFFQHINTMQHTLAITGETLAEAIRGENSLSNMFTSTGVKMLPSVETPVPDGRPYFGCSYTIIEHVLRSNAPFDGVIVETSSAALLTQFVQLKNAYAKSALDFLDAYMDPGVATPFVAATNDFSSDCTNAWEEN